MASSLWNATRQPELSLQTGRRYLVLSFPRWATDCVRRAEPKLTRPLALWEKQNNAMRLVAVDALAARRGLAVGQALSDAKAQVPELEAREIDRPHITHLFAELADWHANASPLVAVLTEHAPYGDLCLDITGVAHLFGGERDMLSHLTGRLAARGLTVAGAVADTVGAAWGLAHFSPGTIAVAETLAQVFGALPVAALRLGGTQLTALDAFGFKTVAQLYQRDRKALASRFGESLVLRLDQALGRVEERLTPRVPVAEHYAERRFAEPIGLLDDVLMCTEDLAVRLGLALEAKGLGAQTFHLFLYLVDHKVISLAVNASRPTRDPGHIARLFKHRAERLADEYDPGFGIDLIRLGASSVSAVDSIQLDALGRRDGTEDLERLFDRLTSRLGPLAVVRAKPVDTYIPERAVKLEPVVARTQDDPQAMPDPDVPRPLRLFPVPEPVVVMAEVPDGPPASMVWRRVRYRFVKSAGPERIEEEWWNSGRRLELAPHHAEAAEEVDEGRTGKLPVPSRRHRPRLAPFAPAAVVRDYYIAEDEAGRRYWLFRQGLYGAPVATPRWYLHGSFA